MRFAFTDEQLLFRDTVRDLLAKECSPAELRACWDRGDARLPRAWVALTEIGVVGLCVPEADGGMGADPIDLVLLLEESGRAGLPDPLVETALVAPALVGPEHRAAIARGELTVAVVDELDGPGVDRANDVANHGATADLVIHLELDRATVLERADLAAEPLPSVDGGRAVARVSWPAGAGTTVPVGDARDRAVVGAAAQLIGLGDRMLAMTAEYVVERKQFGVPIGSFQAVKHHLADALLALEFARPAVYRAAQSLTTDDPWASRDSSMAKAMASDAATGVARAALQCHGAIGYTVEHDLHLFMKRAWALSRAWGSARAHRARVADAVLDHDLLTDIPED